MLSTSKDLFAAMKLGFKRGWKRLRSLSKSVSDSKSDRLKQVESSRMSALQIGPREIESGQCESIVEKRKCFYDSGLSETSWWYGSKVYK